ncbi:MAG: 3-beta hydroxysteroid dehydrogenase [Flaviaesturariibacter sp.]|nr:3-beta hydroxysteroid dehydrogenase [Flaviaesturariibacter sp.]
MVLVTGGTGFLGAYLIRHLVEAGLPVRAIRRSTRSPFFIPEAILQQVEWVDGDVLDVVSLDDAMKGVDAVVHAAAVVSFRAADRPVMNRVNIEGTGNVVNLALDHGVRRFVHISSVAALGRTKRAEKVTEDRTWEETSSNTHYAVSKYHAEVEAWRGFAEGLEGVILNPSTILGYGDWHNSSCAIFRNAYKEFPWYTEGVNGFVGVNDVAAAAVRLLGSDITEKRFIVSAENRSFRSLFTAMAEGFGKKPPHRLATPFLGEIAWRLEGLKHLFNDGKPLLTKESARVAHSKTEFDNSALLAALPGFRFTPLDAVIREACRHYLAGLHEGAPL